MKLKTRIILIAAPVAVVLCLALASALGGGNAGGPPVVDLAAVRRGVLEENVGGTGVFAAQEGRTLVSELNAAVAAVPVRLGDRVEAGQVLVQVDDREAREEAERLAVALTRGRQDLAQKLAGLRQSWRQAALGLAQARKAVAANEELLKVQGVTAQVLEKSRDDLATAEFNLQSTRDQLALACSLPSGSEPPMDRAGDGAIIEAHPETRAAAIAWEAACRRLAACAVRAPIAGTVTLLPVQAGDRVAVGQTLAKVENLNAIRAEVNIDEVDIGKLKLGDTATVKSDSIIGTELTGRVAGIAPTVQPMGNTKVSAVKVSLDPGPARLLPGASCTVRIVSRIRDEALVIPLAALIPGSVPDAVWVIAKADTAPGATAPETVKRREIQAGVSTITEIEVKGGLSLGEEVVVGNAGLLAEGMAVAANRPAPAGGAVGNAAVSGVGQSAGGKAD